MVRAVDVARAISKLSTIGRLSQLRIVIAFVRDCYRRSLLTLMGSCRNTLRFGSGAHTLVTAATFYNYLPRITL